MERKMSITIRCLKCKETFPAEQEMLGQEMNCPNCNEKILISKKTELNTRKGNNLKTKHIIMLIAAILLASLIIGITSNKDKNNIKSCPRCLGDGYVGKDDIYRLGMEDYWDPDSCTSCGGKGNVNAVLIKQQKAIEQALMYDKKIHNKRREDTGLLELLLGDNKARREYVVKLRNIPLCDCPDDFIQAYKKHIAAWEVNDEDKIERTWDKVIYIASDYGVSEK
jgi:DNA-directed RNA polymerase subunit RPC12/RpoP